MPGEWEILGRVALTFVCGFAIGWEREVRGAAAGDRTFALVGMASAAVVAVFAHTSPNAVAGIVTGVGFIGGGLVMRSEHGMVKGITTSATILAVAAIGVVAGGGELMLATMMTVLVLLTLEFRYIPVLRELDARRHVSKMSDDTMPPDM
jgi:putative Mg2+ transporter-C (MgtC) family protein